MHRAVTRLPAALLLLALTAGCGSDDGTEAVGDVVLTPTMNPAPVPAPDPQGDPTDDVVTEQPSHVTETSREVVLGSDESAFVVRGTMRIDRRGAFDSTLLAIGKEWYGDVLVQTGSQFGPFEVRTRVLREAPPVGRAWEDVDEVSIQVGAEGVVATELVNNDPTVAFIDQPGSYRVRVSARDRTSDDQRDREGLLDDEDYDTPVETYLLEAWPADPAPATVLRESSAYAAEVRRGPEPEPVIEGQVAGLAGAARIGRDADHLPGARDLSGELGELTVRRTIPTTPDDLVDYLRFGPTLSRHVPSWGFSAGAAVSDLSIPGYSSASEGHPDQLSGSLGVIRTTSISDDGTAGRDQRWAWLVTAAGGSQAIDDLVVMADTEVLTTYTVSKAADGSPQTTMTIRHSDVPVEWLDDLRAWWRYQLAFVEWYADRY